ncbi:MAG: type I restriction-modification enzyme R subunit C-terminal domain-containing protein, partial [Ramlibacter sp.]
IGRGTRLYEGKDYFTIYDFVRAHQLFSDPEWDGEPVEPEVRKPRVPGDPPAVKEPPVEYVAPVRIAKIKVKLADGKERTIQSMVATSFWGPDGKPLSAAQFMETLFGALPAFFKDEAELRSIWSAPDTRKALLVGLADKGFGAAAMAEMQKLIEAEHSDLFDVLAYVAYTRVPITRQDRATRAHDASAQEFGERQQAFIDFVLRQYVSQGVGELDSEKLSPLLKLRYNNAISDALNDLGGPEQIRDVFHRFQRHLY